ncbi:hypothetical protein EV702DRAFT_528018 [Suillus placidus]|uniref:SAM domain-containing protein n=1 Tax=Suillus placidus TaxID=48579 RepID=A0A9P6ZPR2_9AGAM|nr:hypothetical protein EV702DRAFT_528018 [Suillus placidus]
MTNTTVSPSLPTAPIQSKKHPTILPNAHPYAIKTTSSAVLSRSNSSPHSSPSVKHHYVPPSPTRPRHRHTSSLSSVESESVNEIPRPSPLPVPSSFHSVSPTRASFSLSDDTMSSCRLKRADTPSSSASLPALNDNVITEDNKLPRNPKHWSTDDLASHLTTSLRAGSVLSAEDQVHLLRAIKEQTITGRNFLRLTDADLASLSLTPGQRLYLLEASRALRAEVLRGRIWVDSYHSKNISAHSKDIYTRSTRNSNSLFNSELYNFSTSSVDLILPPSASIGADGVSPVVTLNRSNSVSDSSAQRYRDLARMRARRRGQVKGIVDTWERERGAVSGSEGSTSGSDADSDSDIPSAESPPPPALSNSTISLTNPPPPYTSLKEIEDEPTIEELLASSGPIKGARAWEEDCGLGETVKRIPASTPAPLSLASTPPMVAVVETNADSNESSVKFNLNKFSDLRNGRTNTQKRIVTAIFTGGSDKMHSASDSVPVDDVPQDNLHPGGVMNILDAAEFEVTAVESAEGVSLAPDQVAVPSDDDNVIAVLEASIASTRAQLEAFRARLEIVEAQVAAQEAVNHAYLRPEEAQQPRNAHQPIDHSCIHDPFPAPDDIVFSGHHLGLRSFARSIITRTMGWLYPYSHPGAHPRPEVKATRSQAPSFPLVRPRILPEFRLSYVIMFSFVLCAAVLRKVGKTMRRR